MSSSAQAEDGSFPVEFPLSLRLDDETTLVTLYVLRSFTPFTKAQVYLVQAESHPTLPSPVILKVFDPRFLNDRFLGIPSHTSHPWTLAAETIAAEKRVLVTPRETADDFDIDQLYGEEEAEPWLWEEYYFRLLMDSFESELGAYQRLAELQGQSIPKFYGSGTLVISSAMGQRAIEPRALLIEYIPGVTLRNIDAAAVISDLYRPLIKAVAKFAKFGVLHDDINQNNIIFTPEEAPTRAVLIDFGCAGLRDGGTSNDEWKEAVGFVHDVRNVKISLEKKLGIKLQKEGGDGKESDEGELDEDEDEKKY